MSVDIQDLKSEDLEAVARVHLAAFPTSALTLLGFEAVRRYYDWLHSGPHDAATYGVFQDGQLLGFCFCGKFRGALSGFVKKNRFYLVSCVLLRPWLLVSEEFRGRIKTGVRTLLLKTVKSVSTVRPSSSLPSFGILAIAVSPHSQGTGAGKKLMTEAENIAHSKGFVNMNLSVAAKNEQAIVFYERLGWVRVVEEGIWKGQMTKRLEK